MYSPLKTRIITLDRVLYEGEADMVVAPATNGYLGVLPGHAPLMAALGSGIVKIKKGVERVYFAVFGGFLQVKDGGVIVLADTALAAKEIDIVEARDQVARAEAALNTGPSEKRGWEDLTRAADTARVKLKAASMAAGIY